MICDFLMGFQSGRPFHVQCIFSATTLCKRWTTATFRIFILTAEFYDKRTNQFKSLDPGPSSISLFELTFG